ncbi:MAG TPA: hypothetical protein VGE97_07490 [Nitrososphaera sp.]|jgi:hypothetical protein
MNAESKQQRTIDSEKEKDNSEILWAENLICHKCKEPSVSVIYHSYDNLLTFACGKCDYEESLREKALEAIGGIDNAITYYHKTTGGKT